MQKSIEKTGRIIGGEKSRNFKIQARQASLIRYRIERTNERKYSLNADLVEFETLITS